MTFFEAAVEVLRRTGRPLHYKKITEVAVRDNLLSHVGKAPDQTMSSRLTQEVKRQGKSVIKETRPGVYTIREEEVERLNEEAQKREEREKRRRERMRGSERQEEQQEDKEEEQQQADSSGDDQRKRRRSRRKSSRKDKSNGRQRARSGGAKRRRSRGSKSERKSRSTKSKRKSRSSKNGRKSRSSKSERKSRSTKSERKSRSSKSERKSRSSKSQRKSRSRRSSKNGEQQTKAVTASQSKHLKQGPVRLDGIAEAAYTVLQDGRTKPLDIEKLADEIFERKLVKFHTHDAAATVQAALANDNQIRRQRGHRPLFTQYDKQRWGLTEWGLPGAAVRKEQAILSLSEEIRQDTLDHLGEALIDVQDEALEHIALTLLERLGYQNIKVSKRSSNGDVYFTADWRQGLADVRVCIQVTLEAEDELDDDAVSALRETLHHYSAAEGVIIHLGDISKDAIVESRQEEKAPITLIDRKTFVELLIKHGIGVQAYTTPILMVDTTFIETLKS